MSTITEFLELFYPDPAEPVWLRIIDPKDLPEELRKTVTKQLVTREGLQSDRQLQQALKQVNQTQGIYFVVNAGGNTDAEVRDNGRINAIYCEIDDRPLENQHDLYDNSPWPPSIRVQTRKSVHAYWLLSEQISAEDFEELQEGLIEFFKSDKSVKNLSRVMRVPYFNHIKFEEGEYLKTPITVHTWAPENQYSLAELKGTFKMAEKPVPKFTGERYYSNSLDEVKAELRNRVAALPSYKANGREWASARGVCHNGESLTALRVNLASGSVTCWHECSLVKILSAFGLELPKDNHRFEYVEPRKQKSALYQWYTHRGNSA